MGDSPVSENLISSDQFLSTAGHVQSGRNSGRPLSKTKYSLTTDSELVPRGKGEKNPERGVAEPETVHLQAVVALCPARGMRDGVPVEE